MFITIIKLYFLTNTIAMQRKVFNHVNSFLLVFYSHVSNDHCHP